MPSSAHEQDVNRYYDRTTETTYLGGWDPEHLHLGLFESARDPEYARRPQLALAERRAAVLRMTAHVVESAGIRETDVVLDAGCGVGGTTLFAAQVCGCRLVGLNLNRMQLGIARQRAAEHGLQPRALFAGGDCSLALPLADESVDAILTIESACHYSDRARFYAECRRILRPGGRLAATDLMAADGLSPAERQRSVRPFEAAWVLYDIESPLSFRRMLEQAGLHLTRMELFGTTIRPNGYIMRLGWEVLSSLRAERPLDPDETASAERFRTLSEVLLEGIVGLGHFVAEKPRLGDPRPSASSR
jgi:cyclopropane fatty-acyl-phospholipid synthase-like methyltransferase